MFGYLYSYIYIYRAISIKVHQEMWFCLFSSWGHDLPGHNLWTSWDWRLAEAVGHLAFGNFKGCCGKSTFWRGIYFCWTTWVTRLVQQVYSSFNYQNVPQSREMAMFAVTSFAWRFPVPDPVIPATFQDTMWFQLVADMRKFPLSWNAHLHKE